MEIAKIICFIANDFDLGLNIWLKQPSNHDSAKDIKEKKKKREAKLFWPDDSYITAKFSSDLFFMTQIEAS